jgi:hypothetical protein
MKNLLEVLRAKEQELVKVKREVEALSLVLPLLSEESDVISPTTIPSRINQRIMQLP